MKHQLYKQLMDAQYQGDLDLASLIKACGDTQFTLKMKYGDWQATDEYWGTDGSSIDASGEGKTPEEAVARLYLALHKETALQPLDNHI